MQESSSDEVTEMQESSSDEVTVTDASQHSFGLDAAQYGMLWALYRDRQYGMDRGCQTIPTEQFLRSLKLAHCCISQGSGKTQNGMRRKLSMQLRSGWWGDQSPPTGLVHNIRISV
jgi:hypothetical protein